MSNDKVLYYMRDAKSYEGYKKAMSNESTAIGYLGCSTSSGNNIVVSYSKHSQVSICAKNV